MSDAKFSPVDRPAPTGLRRTVSVWIATGFGLGYSPVASGTVGSVWGIPLVWAMQGFPLVGQIGYAVALCLLAIPFCHDAEAVFARKDDGRIVADEYLTFPLCMLGLPFSLEMVVVAFLTCRFFDIVKLPPANQLQRIQGGTGIVIDDVFACLYSLAANHVIYHLVLSRWG
jgi:phosphatidylglycerophosphatase A